MTTPRVDSPDLRFRLNRGQWALVALLAVLIGALIVNNYAVTAEHRRYSEAVARTETAGNNMFYTLSETPVMSTNSTDTSWASRRGATYN